MFKKILIANRGEIAVRIIRTCREMEIQTVALYSAEDRTSMHVRLADECVQVASPAVFMNGERIIEIALAIGADAIHPGYGFLAEEAEFIRACGTAGLSLIGPPADVVEPLRQKTEALAMARAAGFSTIRHSAVAFDADEWEALETASAEIGYPLLIKSCRGGRGRGARLVLSAEMLPEAVRQAQAESLAVYGSRRVFLEQAVVPSYQVAVQILADKHGNIIHLGEREGSMLQNGQKLVEEAPARCLNQAQREELWEQALAIAKLFHYENAGTVEFVVDDSGHFYFSEIKARIQVDHPLTEMLTRVDLVREQIRIAAGEPITLQQDEIWQGGHAMMCRVSASDPWHGYRPSPGKVQHVRLPGGPEVRIDTYIYGGCIVPSAYDPLIAKLTVWGKTRQDCLLRMRRTLQDFALLGPPTNLPLLQQMLQAPEFEQGTYATHFRVKLFDDPAEQPRQHLRDLAIATAVAYLRHQSVGTPEIPERLQGGWHQSSRRIPG